MEALHRRTLSAKFSQYSASFWPPSSGSSCRAQSVPCVHVRGGCEHARVRKGGQRGAELPRLLARVPAATNPARTSLWLKSKALTFLSFSSFPISASSSPVISGALLLNCSACSGAGRAGANGAREQGAPRRTRSHRPQPPLHLVYRVEAAVVGHHRLGLLHLLRPLQCSAGGRAGGGKSQRVIEQSAGRLLARFTALPTPGTSIIVPPSCSTCRKGSTSFFCSSSVAIDRERLRTRARA